MTLFTKVTERVMLKTGMELHATQIPIVAALCEILEDRLIEIEPIDNEEILALADQHCRGICAHTHGITTYTFTPNELLIFAQNLIAKVSK